MKSTIFDALRAMQENNIEFFRKLSPQDAKGISPYLLLLWVRHPLSNEAERLLNVDELVNPFVFSLSKHPSLLYQLFCVAQSGMPFAKFLFDKKPAVDLRTKVVAEYEGTSLANATDRAARLPTAILIQMAQELDWPAKDVQGLTHD